MTFENQNFEIFEEVVHDFGESVTFPACFSIPIIFSSLNSNYANSLDLRNLQEQDEKAFCYQNLF